MKKYFIVFFFFVITAGNILFAQLYYPVVPPEKRGDSQHERRGLHDANNIATEFWNYGMVGALAGDDPRVHPSVEIPRGTGKVYSDGITPFVLARIQNDSNKTIYIMENGYREGNATSVKSNRTMRFEPRPGYFNPNPSVNVNRFVAMKRRPETWPSSWPDKDTSWNGKWNGYFGTSEAFSPDEESFTVMDDQYYDSFIYTPDQRDATRQGLGLRIEVRGFQWANPQAGNVIFWHYDIANESTTDYPNNGGPENMIFGLYMDAGVGKGQGNISCEGDENADDAAQFDKSSGLNLVYTWDTFGRGTDFTSNCGKTGYLGYAYLETPGKPFDLIDNDQDGITNETRDSLSGPGQRILGQQEILTYIQTHYDVAKFESSIGKIADRPAYKASVWWTGDEDLDWTAELCDFGADGEPGTNDFGEGDSIPTYGEPNFNKTDLHESDQIGLTGFRLFVIADPPVPNADGGITFSQNKNAKQPIVQNFYEGDYPHYFYDYFTTGVSNDPSNPGPFSFTSVANVNIGFLFASGPFTLKAGKQERFSLALAYGSILPELVGTVQVVQAIYNGNYRFATPPPAPTLRAEAGDGFVQLYWDDAAEFSTDPTTFVNDFEGYKIYRSTDYNFNDVNTVVSARGLSQTNNGNPLAQFDLDDQYFGSSTQVVNGLAFNLGYNSGITHTFRDTTVTNGQEYYYAVTAYDFGATFVSGASNEQFTFYPSENSMSVSRTLLGGVKLPRNVVAVRPNPKVPGYTQASTSGITKISGTGTGTVDVKVISSKDVPDGRTLLLKMKTVVPQNIHADFYQLIDSASGTVYIEKGTDFNATGNGSVGGGILPLVSTIATPQVDTTSGFKAGSQSNVALDFTYMTDLPINQRRLGYPNDIEIEFFNSVVDTSTRSGFLMPAVPVKFKVNALSPSGQKTKLKFYFQDGGGKDSTISKQADNLYILTLDTLKDTLYQTWKVKLNASGITDSIVLPSPGDVYRMKLLLPFQDGETFSFKTTGHKVVAKSVKEYRLNPYVVPNPYVGAASFEPAPFGVQGRGDRRMEFRNIPLNSVIRIYTVRGDLVETLRQDGSTDGYVAWDLRTKDNLDVAPGLYIFHVDAGDAGTSIGKFAIIK
ncbi:MAG: hypothetical protein AB1728_03680 [Bacteroidota bacterium]